MGVEPQGCELLRRGEVPEAAHVEKFYCLIKNFHCVAMPYYQTESSYGAVIRVAANGSHRPNCQRLLETPLGGKQQPVFLAASALGAFTGHTEAHRPAAGLRFVGEAHAGALGGA